MSNAKARKQADKLREEAKNLFSRVFKLGDSSESNAIKRAIDCIIGAAIIESELVSSQAAKEEQHDD